ncbi:glyoxalase [Pseudomonas sp. PB101]|uniref:VOC family protein n=1 Tax=Pseudomonas sp. PB101 TaxID=2495428 RepID=UPI0013667B11|nr:VOC family protein [Pseudomonas sp. PB101]MVW84810.1 glyoxalase [Pseudomonas sp. PB101]
MINGIESLIYAVNDLKLCTRYFVDFGLPLLEESDQHAHFRLDEGSNVILRQLGDANLPTSSIVGTGVHEVIWGVDTESNLQRLIQELEVDRPIRRDADGTVHLHTDDGAAIGLKVFQKQPVVSAPSPLNSPGNINRINQHRKWISRARPKTIQHVVFQTPDVDKSWAFYRDRLHFRVSDIQKGFGIFGRAPAAHDHHNIYFLNARLPFKGPDVWGMDGEYRFDHANFGVDDLDEVMVGTNHMQRQGWPESHWGLGRHRIASSLFVYLPCPTGGQAEYGADSDHLDDQWIPRVWNPMFAFFSFITHMAPFMIEEAPWEYSYVQGDQADRLSFTGQPLALDGTVNQRPPLKI